MCISLKVLKSIIWSYLFSFRYWLDKHEKNGFNSTVLGQWFNKMFTFILGTANDDFVEEHDKKKKKRDMSVVAFSTKKKNIVIFTKIFTKIYKKKYKKL